MLLLCGKPFSVSSPLHVIYRLVVSAGDAVGDFTSIHFSHLLSYTPPCQLCPSHHGPPSSLQRLFLPWSLLCSFLGLSLWLVSSLPRGLILNDTS